MTEMTVEQLIGAIRAKVGRTGGWDKDDSWARKIGLTRAQVDQWMTRKAIPHPWKLVLSKERFPVNKP